MIYEVEISIRKVVTAVAGNREIAEVLALGVVNDPDARVVRTWPINSEENNGG